MGPAVRGCWVNMRGLSSNVLQSHSETLLPLPQHQKPCRENAPLCFRGCSSFLTALCWMTLEKDTHTHLIKATLHPKARAVFANRCSLAQRLFFPPQPSSKPFCTGCQWILQLHIPEGFSSTRSIPLLQPAGSGTRGRTGQPGTWELLERRDIDGVPEHGNQLSTGPRKCCPSEQL